MDMLANELKERERQEQLDLGTCSTHDTKRNEKDMKRTWFGHERKGYEWTCQNMKLIAKNNEFGHSGGYEVAQ